MNLHDTSRFFLVYPLDLEDLGIVELEEKLKLFFPDISYAIANRIPGGIEIDCPTYVGLSLNKILRTPTRVLLRLTEFKCRDFPKLFLKISKYNWAPWLIGQTPVIECSSKNSRLFDSRKIEKAIADGVLQFYRHKPVKKKYLDHLALTDEKLLPKIYFRAVDDLCTISIDTTGERLHLRGEKILTGLAPIRENLAALLLIELRKYLKTLPINLIDPMCGSGTFLLEAKNSYAITESRDFSFFHFASVLDNPIQAINNESKIELFFKNLIGFDINPEIVNLANKNLADVDIQQDDIFGEKVHIIENAVIITNPPYGIRVGENINLNYYLKLIESIKNKYNPELLGIIIPKEYKISNLKDFKTISNRSFSNGGIDVVFYVLAKK